MTQPFGHEKLIVYQKGMHFVGLRSALLDRLARRVAACDHLDRGAESILVNIAHASNTWLPKERIVYLGHANGSALECAACLDLPGGSAGHRLARSYIDEVLMQCRSSRQTG